MSFITEKWLHRSRSFKERHSLLHTLVIVTGVVLVWRGIWQLLDEYLFPGDPILSNIVSVVVGVLLLLVDDFRLEELR